MAWSTLRVLNLHCSNALDNYYRRLTILTDRNRNADAAGLQRLHAIDGSITLQLPPTFHEALLLLRMALRI